MTDPNQPRTAPDDDATSGEAAPVDPEPVDPEPVDPRPVDPEPVDRVPAPPMEPSGADGTTAPPSAPPATEWREPPWFPPREKDRREQRANLGSIVVGLIILAIGVYFFLDRTLGVAVPRVQWGTLWPLILIVIGGLILIRSIQRR